MGTSMLAFALTWLGWFLGLAGPNFSLVGSARSDFMLGENVKPTYF